MSGHSKWSTIKHDKAKEDKKRGKLFSKLVKAIAVAVREGGDDPEANPQLRLAIDKAKEANMPKKNIQRAIERGAGRGDEGKLEEVFYEGFGPAKMAVLVKCITDNKNRTSSQLKSLFEQNGGGLGSPGSASYLFTRKGFLLVKKGSNWDEDKLLDLIDCGIDDYQEREKHLKLFCESGKLHQVAKKIKDRGFKVKETDIVFKAETLLYPRENKQKAIRFLEKLEDLDDVQQTYHNLEI